MKRHHFSNGDLKNKNKKNEEWQPPSEAMGWPCSHPSIQMGVTTLCHLLFVKGGRAVTPLFLLQIFFFSNHHY
jgi:hypothetical protein